MKIQYFENVKNEKQLQFIRGHNHCPLCGQTLEFKFEAYPVQIKQENLPAPALPKICEVTVCHECAVQSKSHYYVIH
jgi:hypothetical protein